MPQRTVIVDPVTRIEGHARITIDLDDGDQVQSARLQVLEFRGFEKLVQGMELTRMPLVTARICGVCPAAHHMAAVMAIESGMGVQPPPAARLLRELLYCGHVIHSHAVSTFALAGPDLMAGFDATVDQRNILALLRLDAAFAKKALRLRSIGQKVVEIVGGRGVHPVTAVVGGMASVPEPDRLAAIGQWGCEASDLLQSLSAAVRQALARVSDFEPALPLPEHALALSSGGQHAWLEGDWVLRTRDGTPVTLFATNDYAQALVEHTTAQSYMKTVRLRVGEQTFFVGPLARLQVNDRFSTPRADEALNGLRSRQTAFSALDYIDARLIEMLHCAERMAQLPGELSSAGEASIPVPAPGAGSYISAIEAPRGLLVHHFVADEAGKVVQANFIVATQNNQDAMDAAITEIAKRLVPQHDDELLMHGVEFALRCFDPCLACATHAGGSMPIRVEMRRNGEPVRVIARMEEP